MRIATERLVALSLVPLAAAGALVLVQFRLHFEPPTVPPYALVGGDGGESAIGPGEVFEVEVRPASHVEGAVGARAFLLRGAEVRPWDPPFDVTRDGAVRIRGLVDTLFAGVPPGPWDVAVAVGRPELLPTAPRDLLRARGHDAGPAAGYRLVLARVRLRTYGERAQ